MSGQTTAKPQIAVLRKEGRAVVMSIPAAVTRDLGLKAGDLVAVRIFEGALVAVKVDVSRVSELSYSSAGQGGVLVQRGR